jgi:hypothetical protein
LFAAETWRTIDNDTAKKNLRLWVYDQARELENDCPWNDVIDTPVLVAAHATRSPEIARQILQNGFRIPTSEHQTGLYLLNLHGQQ